MKDKTYRIKPLVWDGGENLYECRSGFGELVVLKRGGKWWLEMDTDYWPSWEYGPFDPSPG